MDLTMQKLLERGEKRSPNNALPKVRAGRWNLNFKSLSTVVRAGPFQFSFCP